MPVSMLLPQFLELMLKKRDMAAAFLVKNSVKVSWVLELFWDLGVW